MLELESIKNKRIAFSVLNWGFGHVTRCVSIIEQLKTQSNEIFIFCNSEQKVIFEQYLFDIVFIDHSGYPFQFRGKGNFKSDLIRSLIGLYSYSKAEKRLLKNKIETFNLDLVISDQRYGFFSPLVPSIFITHQVNFPLRGVFKVFNLVNRYQISKFDRIWIMDNEQNLAGMLSKNKRVKNSTHIGHHSRFLLKTSEGPKNICSILIVNGPLSYSRFLIHHFMPQLQSNEIEYVIGGVHVKELLQGVSSKAVFIPNTEMKRADELMSKTNELCGYFGYSTLMDCKILNCSFNLIATPGQLEQIYLEKLHKKSS